MNSKKQETSNFAQNFRTVQSSSFAWLTNVWCQLKCHSMRTYIFMWIVKRTLDSMNMHPTKPTRFHNRFEEKKHTKNECDSAHKRMRSEEWNFVRRAATAVKCHLSLAHVHTSMLLHNMSQWRQQSNGIHEGWFIILWSSWHIHGTRWHSNKQWHFSLFRTFFMCTLAGSQHKRLHCLATMKKWAIPSHIQLFWKMTLKRYINSETCSFRSANDPHRASVVDGFCLQIIIIFTLFYNDNFAHFFLLVLSLSRAVVLLARRVEVECNECW